MYIIESQTNGRWYIGQTEDVISRVDRHNRGGNKSTRGKGPWELIYKEFHETKQSSLLRERYLKNLKNKNYIRQLLGIN